MAVPAQTTAPTAPAASPAAPSGSEQPGASSPNTGPDAAQVSSPGESEQNSRGPDYFRNAFARVRATRQPASSDPAPQAPAASAPDASQEPGTSETPQNERQPGKLRKNGQPARGTQSQPSTTLPAGEGQTNPDGTLTLTREQLSRMVQSEADRVMARQRNEHLSRQQIEEERRLRREDPIEYARRMEEKDQEIASTQQQLKEASTLLDRQLFTYDRQILDPVLRSLPDALRDKVVQASNPRGIEGRAGLLKNALSALREVWQREGRDRSRESLMNDPTFIKEVLARHGGIPKGEIESPAPSSRASNGAPSDGNVAVNDWIRNAGKATRTESGRR